MPASFARMPWKRWPASRHGLRISRAAVAQVRQRREAAPERALVPVPQKQQPMYAQAPQLRVAEVWVPASPVEAKLPVLRIYHRQMIWRGMRELV